MDSETNPQPEALKNTGGRPTSYSKELALDICARLSEGRSLRTICLSADMPDASTVHRWVLEDRKENSEDEEESGFHKQYTRARAVQAEQMFDEILEIADDGSNDFMTVTKGQETYNVEDREVTNRSRLRVDSRKWYLSKVLPKKFGDKIDMTSDGKALPTPIFDIKHVLSNDSHEKDSETDEED